MSIDCARRTMTVMLICLAIAPLAHAGFAGTDVFLPSVGAGAGVPPSVWYTTVWVHNPNTAPASITVYLLERQANTAPLSYTDTIQPGDTRKYENAVQLMFAKQTFGALRITSNRKVIASSRIYSQIGSAIDESSGQFFAGVPASFAIAAGESTEVIGAHQTQPAAGSDFRFNFGFVEVTGAGACQVEVTVKSATGATLGSKTYWVRRWEQMQKAFASEFPSISTDNARLTVEALSGAGKVIAFGSSVANGSQDPSTFEMAFADSLLAGNAASGITGVTAGMGLSGGGTTGSVKLDVGAGDGLAVGSDSVGLAAGGVTTSKLANAAVTKAKLSATEGLDGQVLHIDGDDLVWQNDGLFLPFDGTTSFPIPALKIVNTHDFASAVGIEAKASIAGVFEHKYNLSSARLGDGDYGIYGNGGAAGGYFTARGGSGMAHVGMGDIGIDARGNTRGGYFQDRNSSGYASVGTGDYGIAGYGNTAGGSFGDLNSSSWSDVGTGSYKVNGSGTVSFVQNHPYDQSSVIVYAAPEGDEVATYTRGTTRLVDGEARVPLGETFRWVTNPDIGLTTYLTPVGDWSDLYVAERTTEEIVVRSAGGAPDAVFDYMVYGLRIGFEESSIVQEKKREAYIPSMAEHRQLYQRRPEMRSYSSLERFKGMRTAIGAKSELDLSRAYALRDAIVEFDPAVHELPLGPEQLAPEALPTTVSSNDDGEARVEEDASKSREGFNPATVDPSVASGSAGIPVDADGNVYARSFRPSSRNLASQIEVSEAVEPGDVLVIDRTKTGMMRRAYEASDTGVLGVVVSAPGIVLGTQPPRSGDGDDHVPGDGESPAARSYHVSVALTGIVSCRVDASYGAIWPGDLLVTSPTPGHAMRAEAPLPGTVLGKALEPLKESAGTINVLVMLR